jgi:hypothetical protein
LKTGTVSGPMRRPPGVAASVRMITSGSPTGAGVEKKPMTGYARPGSAVAGTVSWMVTGVRVGSLSTCRVRIGSGRAALVEPLTATPNSRTPPGSQASAGASDVRSSGIGLPWASGAGRRSSRSAAATVPGV